jgi:hypothetical protein
MLTDVAGDLRRRTAYKRLLRELCWELRGVVWDYAEGLFSGLLYLGSAFKLGAAAPGGAVKLKSGRREVFKYLKKLFTLLTDPQKWTRL